MRKQTYTLKRKNVLYVILIASARAKLKNLVGFSLMHKSPTTPGEKTVRALVARKSVPLLHRFSRQPRKLRFDGILETPINHLAQNIFELRGNPRTRGIVKEPDNIVYRIKDLVVSGRDIIRLFGDTSMSPYKDSARVRGMGVAVMHKQSAVRPAIALFARKALR